VENPVEILVRSGVFPGGFHGSRSGAPRGGGNGAPPKAALFRPGGLRRLGGIQEGGVRGKPFGGKEPLGGLAVGYPGLGCLVAARNRPVSSLLYRGRWVCSGAVGIVAWRGVFVGFGLLPKNHPKP